MATLMLPFSPRFIVLTICGVVTVLLAGIGLTDPGVRHLVLVPAMIFAALTALGRQRVPLQNRVTPFGEIVAAPARGLLFGNRGIIHDDERRIVRPWQVRRWIACRLAFKDGFAKAGRRVIIVAGVPLGTPGATNMLRIAFVGGDTAD